MSKHIKFNSDITIDKISNSLTSLGLEVESITDLSKGLEGFIIAKIIEITQHPNADRLKICKVMTEDKEFSVVCGASNVKEGLKAVFAPIGTIIPSSGLVLKKKDIRGYTGEGMLCSEEELGFQTKSSGIIELSDDAPVGKIYSDWLGLSDPIFEVGLTPNRGDCASVLGIARELAVIGLGTLINKNISHIKGSYKSPIKWEINLNHENKQACSYVKGRHFKGLKNVESPEWLRKCLVSIGLKSISSLVDITNFITFDLGRPLHVFDASKIKGNLSIRMANQGESLLALDGKDYDLNKSILVIADKNNPVSIAGVIGGKDSSCDENTTEIFIESAYFDPQNIAISGRSLNILSDARYRFERGIDPDYVNKGVDILTELVLDICGGEVSEEEQAGKIDITKKIIEFNCDKVSQIGGVEINKANQKDILMKLGFEVEPKKDELSLSVPTWRHDINEEVDVVEELLRVNGYDKLIEFKLNSFLEVKKPVLDINEYRSRLISKAFVKRGLYEVVTFSFLSEKSSKLFKTDTPAIKLDNPISQDLSIMRASLLPNIIDHFIRNHKKGLINSGLFEVGSIYLGDKEEDQRICSAGIRSGNHSARHWSIEGREVDIYDVKKDAYKALEAVGVSVNSLILDKDVPEWYHPGRAGSIKLGKTLLGYFGELHPRYSEEYNMRIVCFELFHKNLPNSVKKKSNKSFVSYSLMPIKRDFAFLIDIEKPSEEIISSIKRTLRIIDHVHMLEINLFDVYSENLLNSNKKSLAIEVIMQPLEKTLKENEILEISNLIVDGVKKDTNAILRE
jgi:phenylalanyl-tRNA synthetase beta chain